MSHTANSLPAPWTADNAEGYDAFLARLSPKARLSVDKHTEACDADGALAYGRCWRRLAAILGRLAPHHVEVSAPFAVRFFIADGRYRQQVFALEDARKGTLQVYMPDVLAAATTKGLLLKPAADNITYPVPGAAGETITLEIVTSDSADVPPYLKPMLGWGRRALRTTLQAAATERQVSVVEKLCELAAETWKNAAPPAQA